MQTPYIEFLSGIKSKMIMFSMLPEIKAGKESMRRK